MIVFDITRITPDGEENCFTAIKTEADKFVLDALFMCEVSFLYEKYNMSDYEFCLKLKRRKHLRNKELVL